MAEQQSRRQTTEQQRAAHAWERISRVPDAARSKYGTWVRRLPALIQSNGLGSTLAFLCSKAKGSNQSGEGLLYRHLSEWVTTQLHWQVDDLLDLVRRGDATLYRRATAEAIAYAIWLKRYAEGLNWGSTEVGD